MSDMFDLYGITPEQRRLRLARYGAAPDQGSPQG
jgi:hypothetical protein